VVIVLNVTAAWSVPSWTRSATCWNSADHIKPAPELNGTSTATFITGIGSVDRHRQADDSHRMLILMDIESAQS
jgi:chemotaxis signal transduction protein